MPLVEPDRTGRRTLRRRTLRRRTLRRQTPGRRAAWMALVGAALIVVACGGGGGDGADTTPAPAGPITVAPAPPTPPTIPLSTPPATPLSTPPTPPTPPAVSVAPATTTTIAASTAAASTFPPTTVAFTSPLTTVAPTTTTPDPGPPALFVDVGAKPGLDDLAAGRALPVEQVVTSLTPGAMVLPAGSRVLDVAITANTAVGTEVTGSARSDQFRVVVLTDLPLDQLRARFAPTLLALAPYEITESDLAAPAVGATIEAPSTGDPTVPSWNITITGDATIPGAWEIVVRRTVDLFPREAGVLPGPMAVVLESQRAVLTQLEWDVDGWTHQTGVRRGDGAPAIANRLTFRTGTTDPAEAADQLAAALDPQAVREALDADTFSFTGADGNTWVIGERGGADDSIRGSFDGRS